MALVPFNDLLAEAERRQYAVGYFESWNLESLQAVADAAEAMRSPVLLGFSGIYLCHSRRQTLEQLAPYAALGSEICRGMSVPTCLVFNECPQFERTLEATQLGFGMVMFSDPSLSSDALEGRMAKLVPAAHRSGIAVEGEPTTVPGVGGELSVLPADKRLTGPRLAQAFVERTGVDALAVNIGQAHLHGRAEVHLDFGRLKELKAAVSVPLVLHGGTSVARHDLQEAIALGIRKINVGSILKRCYFEALRSAIAEKHEDYNPYEVVGSGYEGDILQSGRAAVRKAVESFMGMFGSTAKAYS